MINALLIALLMLMQHLLLQVHNECRGVKLLNPNLAREARTRGDSLLACVERQRYVRLSTNQQPLLPLVETICRGSDFTRLEEKTGNWLRVYVHTHMPTHHSSLSEAGQLPVKYKIR